MAALLLDLASGKGTPQKLLWTTDLHVDATEKAHLEQFYQFIEANDPAAILIGGDISNGYQSLIHLKNMGERLKKPLYFVLGNHDFYNGSIKKMRGKVRQLVAEVPNLVYLTEAGVIELSPTTALIG
ncbi:MAG: metallophosphoesterase, partial [Parachlamydia sp.]|nr:metallophosphoesterase [Parachlamydia sp.]